MRTFATGLVLGLVMVGSACGGDDAADTTTTPPPTEPTTTAPAESPTTTTTTTTGATDTTSTVAPTSTPPTSTAPATTAPPTTAPTLVDVRVYFLRDERLAIAHREVAAPAVLRGALEALLAGPTSPEQTDGLTSTIPAGTTILGVDLDDGLATVDLSGELGSGGGSLSMTTRVAEIVFTATQFPNVDRVRFWIDGAPIEYLGGEGVVMTEPWTRSMVDRTISGSVIVDTPTPGATVSSPFTVTGEGDVYEAQFPIEIWRGGVQIGGVAPVTAGAWGTWADFETTIALDGVAPGPIELVAYDEGGCGTEPGCPEIVRTVVPLTLAAP